MVDQLMLFIIKSFWISFSNTFDEFGLFSIKTMAFFFCTTNNALAYSVVIAELAITSSSNQYD